MIYKDSKGYPVSRTDESLGCVGDGGDSCVRASLIKITSPTDGHFSMAEYVKGGLGVRHPDETPWNNPWNFTKDQLLCLIAALYKIGRHDLIRKIFYAHFIRLFFCQNFQRDAKGTWKYPWPHKMQGGDPKDNGKWRIFDFADPIWAPDHLWHMIKGGRIYPLYFVALLGIPLLWFRLYLNTVMSQKKNELNQIFCQSVVAGEWAEKLFLKTKDLIPSLIRYWDVDRGEGEYVKMITNYLGLSKGVL